MLKEEIPFTLWEKLNKSYKLLMIFAVFGWFLVISLVVSIILILPLKEKEYVYIEFSSSGNNFVRIARAEKPIKTNETLIRAVLRNYIINRETIDKITESQRYKKIFAMSTDDVWNEFKKIGNSKESLFHKAGVRRTIIVRRDSPISSNIHQIEITTIDTQDNGNKIEKLESEWVVTIEYDFFAQDVSDEMMLFNPTGLFIKKYNMSERIKVKK